MTTRRDLDLPRGEARELVVDGERMYELNGEDSRALAVVGAFRVVPDRELGSDRDGAQWEKVADGLGPTALLSLLYRKCINSAVGQIRIADTGLILAACRAGSQLAATTARSSPALADPEVRCRKVRIAPAD